MPQSRSVLWGDLHRQTALTCGAGDFEDHVAAARRDGLDFLAVTDNAVLTEDPRLRQFVGTELARHPHFFPALEAHSISRDEWDALRRFAHASEARTPIFFLGYEWCSNRYGDRNVYYVDDGPLHRPSELSALHPTLKRFGALAVLHHTGYARGRRGADWNHHDGTTERLVEIFSTQHGSSEGLGSERPLHSRSMGGLTAEGSVNAALARRYKLGFTGGTDLHALEQTPGRTGALVDRDDRAAVWDALWNRRTLATTGRSFVFDVAVDGHGIGSILTTDRLPTVRATLPSDGWERAELVRNGTVAAAWARTDVRAEDGVVPLAFQERAADVLPDNYYYFRVQLGDRELAWSSPIWVSLLPDTPPFRDTLYWLPEERCFLWGRKTERSLQVSIGNRYAAHAAAGGLVAPEDVTLTDMVVSVVDPAGAVVASERLGDLEEGGEHLVDLPMPNPRERVRLSFLDPFGNRRHVERGDWLDADATPPFLERPRTP